MYVVELAEVVEGAGAVAAVVALLMGAVVAVLTAIHNRKRTLHHGLIAKRLPQ
jgi:hypothetical protein